MRLTLRAWMKLGLAMLGLPCVPALAFNQAPLSLSQGRGYIQLSNPTERTIDLNLQVFSVLKQDGRSSADLRPLSTEEAEQLIRLRPTQLRLSAGSTRTIPYTILDSSRDFFLCGVSSQGLFTLRVCSRWRSAPSPAALSSRNKLQ
jgi:hypothetical protein